MSCFVPISTYFILQNIMQVIDGKVKESKCSHNKILETVKLKTRQLFKIM